MGKLSHEAVSDPTKLWSLPLNWHWKLTTILFCNNVWFPRSRGLCPYHPTHRMPGTQALNKHWLNRDHVGNGAALLRSPLERTRWRAQLTESLQQLGLWNLSGILAEFCFPGLLPVSDRMQWGNQNPPFLSDAGCLSRPPLFGDSPLVWLHDRTAQESEAPPIQASFLLTLLSQLSDPAPWSESSSSLFFLLPSLSYITISPRIKTILAFDSQRTQTNTEINRKILDESS